MVAEQGINGAVEVAGGGFMELLEAIAGPAMVTRGQFADMRRSSQRSGEHRLVVAVLEDALRCWRGRATTNLYYGGGEQQLANRRERLSRETEEWLFDEDSTRPFSMNWCCEKLGFDPDWLRAGLRKWRDRDGRLPQRQRPMVIRENRMSEMA